VHLVDCTIGIYYDARTYEYLKFRDILTVPSLRVK